MVEPWSAATRAIPPPRDRKPPRGLSTNLIVGTSRRTYHSPSLTAQRPRRRHYVVVGFYYPDELVAI